MQADPQQEMGGEGGEFTWSVYPHSSMVIALLISLLSLKAASLIREKNASTNRLKQKLDMAMQRIVASQTVHYT